MNGKETKDLLKLYIETGRPISLRNAIAELNQNLIHGALKSIKHSKDKVYNKDYEEIYQEAYIILLESIEKYNPSKGSLSSFLYSNIRKLHQKTETYNIDISLDKPVDNGENENITLLDTVEDESKDVKYFDECIEEREFKEKTKELIENTLEEKQKDFIYELYSINTNVPKKITIKELAKKYNLEYDKVRGLITKAKEKLEKNVELKRLYYEYIGIDPMRSISIIEYQSKTGRVYDPTGNIAIKRLNVWEKYQRLLLEIVSIN